MPRFPLIGEPLAIDLANTVVAADGGGTKDLLPDERSLAEWLALHEPELGRLARARPALADVRALRTALRRVLQAATEGRRPPAAALRAVNDAATGAHRALRWDSDGPQTAWQTGAASGADHGAVLAPIARSAIEVLGEQGEQLRRCGGPGCLLFFVATNPRRRWCSDRLCGNRVRVSRHRHRHAGA